MQLTLTVAALSTDDMVVLLADVAGGLLVAAVMGVSGLAMMRGALPDLLDRAPGAGSPACAPAARAARSSTS